MAERFITVDTFKRQGQVSLNVQPRTLAVNLVTPLAVNLSYGVDGVAWSGAITLQSASDELFTSPTTVATYTQGGVYDIGYPSVALYYRLVATALTSGEVQYELFAADNSDVLAVPPSNPLNAAMIRRVASPGGAVVTAKNAIYADALYNIKASNTGKIRAAAARTDTNPIINCIGNSTFRGQSTGAGTAQGPNSWPVVVADILSAKGIPANGANVIGFGGYFGSGTQTAAQYATADARVTATAGTVPSGQVGAIGGNSWNMAAASASITITLPNVTHIDVLYGTRTGGGTFSWSIDGGGTTNVSTTGTEAQTRLNVGGALTLGSHAITLAYVSGATAVVLGVIGYNNTSTRKELLFLNLGISGATSATMVADTGTAYSRKNGYKALSPSLSLIEGGVVNDWRQSVAVATSKANLRTLCTDALISGDVILTIPIFDNETSGLTTSQGQYVTAMYELADELDLGVIDIRKLWLSFSNADGLGLYSDTVHPTARGYRDIAKFYARVIADIVG